MNNDHSPSDHTGSVRRKNKPPMADDANSVSNSALTWMTLLSFLVFGSGLSIAVAFGGL